MACYLPRFIYVPLSELIHIIFVNIKKCIYMGTLKSMYYICLGLYLFVLLVCQVEFSSF